MKKIGVIGSGPVGVRLATGFAGLGHNVTLGVRGDKKPEGWQGSTGDFEAVAKDNEILILAVKGSVAEQVIKNLAPHISGKIVIDVTNPISSEPAENGVLRYFTSLDESLMERLVKLAPKAKFVKAFNIVGNDLMTKPDFDQKPTMFIGGDEDAKAFVSEALGKFGWEVEDLGGAEAARAIEPLCMLWCIPGFLRGEWHHALKLLK